jgi:hypothetical protein
MDMIDRRKHPRLALRRRVIVRLSADRTLEAWTLDVSSGGLRLQLPMALAVGQTLFVELPMSDSWLVQESARICHVKRNYSGAEVGLAWLGTGSRVRAATG